MDISIIIPSYNEEKRIGPTLQRIADYMQTQAYTYEVIVIDNGNVDKTASIVLGFKDKIKNIKILHARSHGKGWAIKEGMLKAEGKYRLYTDADNSTDIAQLEDLLNAIKEGYDIAISSRKVEGALIQNPQPKRRRLTSYLFSRLVNFIVPLGFKDTQNGFKLFTEEAALKIFPHQIIFYWAFDVEILALAQIFSLRVKEVPIVWIDDADSRMSLNGMVRMLFEVIFIRINLWVNMYNKNERRSPERLRDEMYSEKENRKEV
ncbi:MAG: glycosyltransferase family 2 protein [bacterium]|nr:glycosyltransferase family 2 protein [bacterium]